MRHHGDVARIEIPTSGLQEFFSDGRAERLSANIKSVGYKYVTLDLEGFRSGSLNEVLSKNGRHSE